MLSFITNTNLELFKKLWT